MRSLRNWLFLVLLLPGSLAAQEAYKVEELKEAVPAEVSKEIGETLNAEGLRILTPEGQPFARIWLRKAVPASAKPAGANGVIQFPFLKESELLGVIQIEGEAHDYRDQSIEKGVYTFRYGLQPVNGDHLGVSPFRDYSLLLPAAKDKTVAVLPRKQLESTSADAAGTSHPAIFFMLAAPSSAKPEPSMIHDEEKNTWRVILPLNLQVEGESSPLSHPVSLIVVGASEGA